MNLYIIDLVLCAKKDRNGSDAPKLLGFMPKGSGHEPYLLIHKGKIISGNPDNIICQFPTWSLLGKDLEIRGELTNLSLPKNQRQGKRPDWDPTTSKAKAGKDHLGWVASLNEIGKHENTKVQNNNKGDIKDENLKSIPNISTVGSRFILDGNHVKGKVRVERFSRTLSGGALEEREFKNASGTSVVPNPTVIANYLVAELKSKQTFEIRIGEFGNPDPTKIEIAPDDGNLDLVLCNISKSSSTKHFLEYYKLVEWSGNQYIPVEKGSHSLPTLSHPDAVDDVLSCTPQLTKTASANAQNDLRFCAPAMADLPGGTTLWF